MKKYVHIAFDLIISHKLDPRQDVFPISTFLYKNGVKFSSLRFCKSINLLLTNPKRCAKIFKRRRSSISPARREKTVGASLWRCGVKVAFGIFGKNGANALNLFCSPSLDSDVFSRVKAQRREVLCAFPNSGGTAIIRPEATKKSASGLFIFSKIKIRKIEK